MKRLLSALFSLSAALLFLATTAMAAGTMTDKNGNSLDSGDWELIGARVWKLEIICTDDTAGIDSAIPVPTSLYGANPFTVLVEIGATPPTGDLDIQVEWHGRDITGGGLQDCSLSESSSADYALFAPMDEDLNLVMENNTQSGAIVTVTIYARN